MDLIYPYTQKELMITNLVLMTLSIYLFYVALRSLKKERIIADIPTSHIRSAPQGYVEVEGQGTFPSHQKPLIGPVSNKPCLWYHYRLEVQRDKSWVTQKNVTTETPFLIDDQTGQCLVFPKGAEMVGTKQTQKQPFSLGACTRETEVRLEPDSHLYVLGEFKTLETQLESQEDENPIPIPTLRKPHIGANPFIISTYTQKKLISKYRWTAFFSSFVFIFAIVVAYHQYSTKIMWKPIQYLLLIMQKDQQIS